jgi:SAM-dependent methyltransferase
MIPTTFAVGELAGLILLLVILVTYALYLAPRKRIGYIPLPAHGVAAVVKALKVRGSGSFYDLGCGDGGVISAVLRQYPAVTGVGIEYHPMVAWLARWRLRGFGKQRVGIIRGDIIQQDLRPATHLFAYLNDATMALLEPKLKHELRPGSRLVACDFPLPHTKPSRTVKIGEPWQLGQTLYIYEY